MGYELATFKKLAELRFVEAEILHAQGQWSGAYYLAGYAVECILKAKIASQFRANEIPEKDVVNKIYTHDLEKLLGFAGLQEEHKQWLNQSTHSDSDWKTIKQWNEEARYKIWTREQASAILGAVGGSDGLLQWVLKRL